MLHGGASPLPKLGTLPAPSPSNSPTQPGAASTSHNAPRPSPVRPLLPGCPARSSRPFFPQRPARRLFHPTLFLSTPPPRLSPLTTSQPHRLIHGEDRLRAASQHAVRDSAPPLLAPSHFQAASRARGLQLPAVFRRRRRRRTERPAPPLPAPPPAPPAQVCARNPGGAKLVRAACRGARRRAGKVQRPVRRLEGCKRGRGRSASGTRECGGGAASVPSACRPCTSPVPGVGPRDERGDVAAAEGAGRGRRGLGGWKETPPAARWTRAAAAPECGGAVCRDPGGGGARRWAWPLGLAARRGRRGGPGGGVNAGPRLSINRGTLGVKMGPAGLSWCEQGDVTGQVALLSEDGREARRDECRESGQR